MYTTIHHFSDNINLPLNRRNPQTLTTSIEIWRQEVLDSTSQPTSPSKRRSVPISAFWKTIFSPRYKRNAIIPKSFSDRSPDQDGDSPPFTTQMYSVILPKEACAACGVVKDSPSIAGSNEREDPLAKLGEKLERLARAQRLLEAIDAGERREKEIPHRCRFKHQKSI